MTDGFSFGPLVPLARPLEFYGGPLDGRPVDMLSGGFGEGSVIARMGGGYYALARKADYWIAQWYEVHPPLDNTETR